MRAPYVWRWTQAKREAARLIRAARNNAQIATAFETVQVFNNVFDATARHLPQTRAEWTAFIDERTAKEQGANATYAFPELRKRLVAAAPAVGS